MKILNFFLFLWVIFALRDLQPWLVCVKPELYSFIFFFFLLKLESVLTWKAGCLVDKNLELLDPTLVDEGEPDPPLGPRCPLPQAAPRQRIHRSSTKNIV
jgi:hypothetical protein